MTPRPCSENVVCPLLFIRKPFCIEIAFVLICYDCECLSLPGTVSQSAGYEGQLLGLKRQWRFFQKAACIGWRDVRFQN